jgi:AcrR family transcriptional regulator
MTTRPYSMDARRAAVEATRERILEAAAEQFMTRWFDEVTINEVAQAAGVSGQTVLNHFGDKESLFAATADVIGTQVLERRASRPGDIDGAIAALVHDYEESGDAVLRALATEQRMASIKPLLDRGRQGHRDWVERTFDRPDLVRELIVATDVYTWKLLRRDQRLSEKATRESMTRIVRALLETTP